MSYNRFNVGGGGYPTPNPSAMYTQPPPMPPAHQHPPPPPQYGGPQQHYGNRNPGIWNMPPGPQGHPPQGQNINPWINNNIPNSFRYGNIHDNRNQTMNMGPKSGIRMVMFSGHL